MTSRRKFMGQSVGVVAGIALTGCAATGTGSSWKPSPGDKSVARLPVAINGQRVRTIDVHAHCFVHSQEIAASIAE